VTTRSSALFVGHVEVAGGTDRITVPPSTVWLVKTMQLFNLGSSPTLPIMYMVNPATGTQIYLYSASIAVQNIVLLQLWTVLEPGDELAIYSSEPGLHYWVSGAQLPVGSQ
jgi:hypothetical protein